MSDIVKCFFDNNHKIKKIGILNHYLRSHRDDYSKYRENKLICEDDPAKLFKDYNEKLKHECKCVKCKKENKDHNNLCEKCKKSKNDSINSSQINDISEISLEGANVFKEKLKEEEKIDKKLPIFDWKRFKKNKDNENVEIHNSEKNEDSEDDEEEEDED